MMLIVRRSFFITALQFVVITRYYVSCALPKETSTHAKHRPIEDFRYNLLPQSSARFSV
jgi:hypothetical protein